MYKIVVTDDRFGSYEEEKEVFKKLNAELIILDSKSTNNNILQIQDANALLVNLFPMSKDIITNLKNCKIISRYGVGYDNVDTEAATHKGIWLSNVPDYSREDVSDQALALLMGNIRKIAYKDRMIRNGKWDLHSGQPVHRMKSAVLGLIGYGAIAKRFHEKTSAFGFSKVLVYDPFIKKDIIRDNGAIPSNLDNLLSESDYISIHVPLNETSRMMIGKKQLGLMKKNSILINTSRGGIIDEDALAEVLIKEQIAGAGLDVFEKEPVPDTSPLLKLDNIILSDHTAWYSAESVKELKTKAAMNVLAVLEGGKPNYPVNNL